MKRDGEYHIFIVSVESKFNQNSRDAPYWSGKVLSLS